MGVCGPSEVEEEGSDSTPLDQNHQPAARPRPPAVADEPVMQPTKSGRTSWVVARALARVAGRVDAQRAARAWGKTVARAEFATGSDELALATSTRAAGGRQACGGKIIGISGCTRAGKSRLARGLRQALGEDRAVVLCQDRHFVVERVAALGGNWEASECGLFGGAGRIGRQGAGPPSIPGEGVCCRLPGGDGLGVAAVVRFDWQLQVIAEGFRCFYDSVLASAMDWRLWIDIDRQTCQARRAASKPVPAEYFEQLIWPSHQEYQEMLEKRPELQVALLDGSLPEEALCAAALRVVLGRQADGGGAASSTMSLGGHVSHALPPIAETR